MRVLKRPALAVCAMLLLMGTGAVSTAMPDDYPKDTGRVPRPTILLDKKTDDAHDNPVIAVDGEGHIWLFSTSHGLSRPSCILKSKRPHDAWGPSPLKSGLALVPRADRGYNQPQYVKNFEQKRSSAVFYAEGF
jgi:hypothetical protein